MHVVLKVLFALTAALVAFNRSATEVGRHREARTSRTPKHAINDTSASNVVTVADIEKAHPGHAILQLVKEVVRYRAQWQRNRNQKEDQDLWHRLSGTVVLAVGALEERGAGNKRHRWKSEHATMQFLHGVNTEVDLNDGSVCAESSLITQMHARFIPYSNLRYIAVLDAEGGRNPLAPCLICQGWLERLQTLGNQCIQIVTFKGIVPAADEPDMDMIRPLELQVRCLVEGGWHFLDLEEMLKSAADLPHSASVQPSAGTDSKPRYVASLSRKHVCRRVFDEAVSLADRFQAKYNASLYHPFAQARSHKPELAVGAVRGPSGELEFIHGMNNEMTLAGGSAGAVRDVLQRVSTSFLDERQLRVVAIVNPNDMSSSIWPDKVSQHCLARWARAGIPVAVMSIIPKQGKFFLARLRANETWESLSPRDVQVDDLLADSMKAKVMNEPYKRFLSMGLAP